MASSRVKGRRATESVERTRWASVVRATAGNLWTTTGTVVGGETPTATATGSVGASPFHFLRGWRFLVRQRALYFTAWLEMRSRASFTAESMSGATARPTIG